LFKVIHLQNIYPTIECPSTLSKAAAHSPYHLAPYPPKSKQTQPRPVSTIFLPTQSSTTVFLSSSLQPPSTTIKKAILLINLPQIRNFSKKSRLKSFRRLVCKKMKLIRTKFYECSEKSKTGCKSTRNKTKSESPKHSPIPKPPKTRNQLPTTQPQKSNPHQAKTCTPIAEDNPHNNPCYSYPRPHPSRSSNPSHYPPGPTFRY
jgi:hypothetical protein